MDASTINLKGYHDAKLGKNKILIIFLYYRVFPAKRSDSIFNNFIYN